MKLKRILCILLISLIPLTLFADSESLETQITTVSFGPHHFGMDLAPTGTNFVFYRSVDLFPKLQHSAFFSTRLVFGNPDNIYFDNYNYKTGTPKWIHKYVDIKDDPDYFLGGRFFNPEAYLNISLSQSFGTNPVAKSGSFINLSLDFNSRYSIALENLDVNRGKSESVFFDPITNKYKEPFGPGSVIPAYPWLQDNRSTLANYIRLSISFDFSKPTGYNVSDGFYMSVSAEFAPFWLANNISMELPTADYYSLSGYISQNLTLYSKKQDNGLNWLSIKLRHENSYSYMDGSVIPRHRLPTDRLNQSFSDSTSITLYGPQFIAWDCYTDMSIGLYSAYNFGHVLNEPSKITQASEWYSSLGLNFHMKLFGFMHFSYDINYKITTGIHTDFPAFWQQAKINFYIAL